jgi:hypothetical protein
MPGTSVPGFFVLASVANSLKIVTTSGQVFGVRNLLLSAELKSRSLGRCRGRVMTTLADGLVISVVHWLPRVKFTLICVSTSTGWSFSRYGL